MADLTRALVALAMFLAASRICSSKLRFSSADCGSREGGTGEREREREIERLVNNVSL